MDNENTWPTSPDTKLDGRWPTGTWYQQRLAKVLLERAKELRGEDNDNCKN